GLVKGRLAVAGLANHFHAGLGVDQRFHTLAHDHVIVGQEDAQFIHGRAGPLSSGMRTYTVVPRPGLDSICNVPPTRATRSFMPSTPRVFLALAASSIASASNPLPSSSTMASSWCGRHSRMRLTLAACACLTTLVSAS